LTFRVGMTEALPMDVDFEFTVARLAKIANNNNFVGLLGALVRLGSLGEFVRDNPFPACIFSTLNAVSRSGRQKRHKRDIRRAEPCRAITLLVSSSNCQHGQVPMR
jgi:hypothetical protein